MEALLWNVQVPEIQYGGLDRRCRSLGLTTLPLLGLGVSRYVVITSDQQLRDSSNQRIFDLTYGKNRRIPLTIPIATMDLYIQIRRAYSGESIGESALISLAIDSLDKLRDDQLVRLYDTWRTCSLVLNTLI